MTDSANDILHVYCSICNLRNEARVIGTHIKSCMANTGNDPIDSPYYVTVYKFAVCKSCGSPFLHEQDFIEVPGEVSVSQGEQVLYPYQHELLGDGLPETVRRAQHNAARSYAAGLYEPCVIMCRKCLEAMCYELGEKKGSLQQRLLELQNKKIIDSKLIIWADGLRLIGNDAAHDPEIEIEQIDAIDSLHFIEAILMYVFTLNERYEEFRNRRTKPSLNGFAETASEAI